MRLLWTLVKLGIAAVLVIPIAIIVLGIALGVFGALLGLAILTLKLALLGLICVGVFRLIARLVRGPGPAPQPRQIAGAPKVDPYYEAAMRELDRDIGPVR
jgi:ABC-type transport system involved in cytochrome c biogenesis permease subunit